MTSPIVRLSDALIGNQSTTIIGLACWAKLCRTVKELTVSITVIWIADAGLWMDTGIFSVLRSMEIRAGVWAVEDEIQIRFTPIERQVPNLKYTRSVGGT